MKHDFEGDLLREINNIYNMWGIKFPSQSLWKDILLDYLTIKMKLVNPIPRPVLINPDLEIKLNDHQKKNEVYQLKYLFEKGGNVNLYQSKRLFQSKFHDHLSYEWSIYHFHLSLDAKDIKSRMKYGDSLLFVYITYDVAIFLDIDKHRKGIFGDKKWIEILDNHFPEKVESYIEPEMTKVFPELNSELRQTLWDKGHSTFLTEVNGKVYRSKGIGRTTSGHSVIVMKTFNAILRWLHVVNSDVVKHRNYICTHFNLDINVVDFKLRFRDQKMEIFEIHSNNVVFIFPNALSSY